MPKVYYVSRTLLGGDPDCNRRTVYEADLGPSGKADFSNERPVCVLNADRTWWSANNERWLNIIVAALRKAAADEPDAATG